MVSEWPEYRNSTGKLHDVVWVGHCQSEKRSRVAVRFGKGVRTGQRDDPCNLWTNQVAGGVATIFEHPPLLWRDVEDLLRADQQRHDDGSPEQIERMKKRQH